MCVILRMNTISESVSCAFRPFCYRRDNRRFEVRLFLGSQGKLDEVVRINSQSHP